MFTSNKRKFLLLAYVRPKQRLYKKSYKCILVPTPFLPLHLSSMPQAHIRSKSGDTILPKNRQPSELVSKPDRSPPQRLVLSGPERTKHCGWERGLVSRLLRNRYL